MDKKISEGDRITLGWDKKRRTDGKPSVFFLHYKRHRVIFSKPNELEQDLVALINRIDNRELD